MTGSLLIGLYGFVLATLLGLELARKLHPALRLPLLSAAGAISGVVAAGAIGLARTPELSARTVLGAVALALASASFVGGIVVSDRVLRNAGKRR